MTLQDRLMEDMKAAMRAGDELRRSVIRLVRAAVQNEQISKGRELDDAGVTEVLARMVRQYRESIDIYRQYNRLAMAEREESELGVVMEYLPKQLTRDDVLELARQAAQEVGAHGPGDKGKLMGRLMPQLRGRAEGTMVNEVVTELLDSVAS